jgi:hypothetical protein
MEKIMTYMLGRLPPHHDFHPPMLAMMPNVITGLPAAPASIIVPAVPAWQMLGNNDVGNCTIASYLHCSMLWKFLNSSMTSLPTTAAALQDYSDATGYNPNVALVNGENPTDQGAVETDVLGYIMKNGLLYNADAPRETLSGYAAIHVLDRTLIMQALAAFGCIYAGVSLPLTAQGQDVWDLTSIFGDGAPGSWGGHAVPIVGADINGLTCVTWGGLKRMTWRFWNAYFEEAYALISIDWLSKGITPRGETMMQLAYAVRELSGKLIA